MTLRRWVGLIIVIAGLSAAAAQQASDYLIVSMPIGTVTPDTTVWVKWAGASRSPLLPTYLAPDSGYIYYSRSPGGGLLSNYRNRVNKPWIDTSGGRLTIHDNEYTHPTLESPVAQRGTAFRPSDQTDMGAGVFYCIVALPLPGDTLVSNEFQILVESPDKVVRVAPVGSITALTPTFSWNSNPGVPYYHVILSDEPISFDMTSGKIDLKGLSIIWQAITPDNQIVYGAPDPSKTITADPPPLSPGAHYTWVVLNNYGNHPMFSSFRSAKLPPGEFTVAGIGLKRPKNVYPAAPDTVLTSTANEKFSFKWTNLDPKANTYKIYVYVSSDFSGILSGVSAQMAVWQSEVRAQSGVDTMSLEIEAASILTSNKYNWRVMAVDEQGAGTAGDTTSFRYSASTGTMSLSTRENIPVAHDGKIDTLVTEVGLVQATVEVLTGSMEAPLLFYTDTKGNLERTRPAGTYRVTMIKDGFENLTKTIVLGENDTTRDTFFLKRPESRAFGRVLDESEKGINLATVRGVSDRGDTVTAATDGLGNFVLNCYAADWQVGFEMAGYKALLPRKITVAAGQSYDFQTVTMRKNPFTLSGVVTNSDGQPLLGVKVQLLRDGTLLGEMPSTPQMGAFSFSVPAGTYALTAEKVGFSSYSGQVEVASSKNVTVAMAPRATLVSGYAYGTTYINGQASVAPITTAKIAFVKVGGSDTLAAAVDGVYGKYSISLPGNLRFVVFSSATGFAPKERHDTVSTGTLANVTYNDTLAAYAMISGTVKLSAGQTALGEVGVNLVNSGSGAIAAAARSAANGYFELRGLPDGSYAVVAGKEGFVLDSIQGSDTVVVTGGRPTPSSIALFMKPGDKTVKWVVQSVAPLSGQVKVLSPMVKTIGLGDSLSRAGAGMYVVAIDAAADSLLDLSYHSFAVPESAVVYRDTVALNVLHRAADTLSPALGLVSVVLGSTDTLDSATLYYKDVSASQWFTMQKSSRAQRYEFSVLPPRDGSLLEYYFKAYRRGDVYGYDKEPFYTYVTPDTSRLSKFEIVPYSSDTLHFSAACEVQFSFRGYCSAAFIPAVAIDSGAITWQLTEAQGCVLERARGLTALVKTARTRLAGPAVLTVKIDTTKLPCKVGLRPELSVRFLASGSALAAVAVKRVDAKSPNPISTSLGDRAEFIAEGTDKQGGRVTLSPRWSVLPADAGAIGSDGVYRPARNFLGSARIFAEVAGLRGEYRPDPDGSQKAQSRGLSVRHVINSKDTPDTASNGQGVTLIFPANVVTGSDVGLVELTVPELRNILQRGFINVRMMDSNAYDIKELQNVSFRFTRDSIRLSLDLPAALQAEAAAGKRRFSVARWNEDSLLWNPLANAIVSPGGKTASAQIAHFSRYAVVAPPKSLSLDCSVSPNPFSPRVRPQGMGMPFGTCIKVKPEMPEFRLQCIDIRIYTVIGDLVWGVQITDALAMQYSVWWDGTTTERVESANPNQATITVHGSRMCRNGRYFVVVTAKDYNNKEQKLMKQVILVK